MSDYEDDDFYDEDTGDMKMDSVKTDEVEEAAKELMRHFGTGVTQEALQACCRNVAVQLAQNLLSTIQNNIKEIVMKSCGEEIVRIAKEEMPKLFSEVLAEKIIVTRGSWNQEKKPIADIVKDEMNQALQKLSDQKQREDLIKGAISSFMSKEVTDTAKRAVDDFKAELLRDLGKEGMRQIVQAVASTVAGDKKLLAVLGN